MAIHSDDFQSLYRRYAYSLYREVYEELKDVEATREILYRVFSRVREEGIEDSPDLESRIYQYKLAYVLERKKAKLALDRVWYQMKNDEILGREPQLIAPEVSDMLPVPEVPGVEVPIVTESEPEQTQPEQALTEEREPERETVEEAVNERVPEPSIDDLLADMQRRRRPRRIREVFPDEEETVAEPIEEVVSKDTVEAETPKEKKSGAIGILWVLLVLALVLFLWILANLLMAHGILPFVDLGYAWFNENVMVLFPIVAKIAG